jgi:sugar lactone lactonase YvrE
LQFKGDIIRYNPETHETEILASGYPMPTAVSLDSHGNIYIVDFLTGQLSRLDSSTYEAEVLAEFHQPLDNLTVDANDIVYVSAPAENAIYSVDPVTRESRQQIGGGLSIPGGVALVEDGDKITVLVSSPFGHSEVNTETLDIERTGLRKEIFPSTNIAVKDGIVALPNIMTGQIQILSGVSREPLALLEDFVLPYDVEFGADGTLYVAEFGKGQIVAINLDSNSDRRIVSEGLKGPIGLAVSKGNTIFVTESESGQVSEINVLSGQRRVVADGLIQPEGLAIMKDGRLVVAEVGLKRLVAIEPTTAAKEVIASDLPIGLSFKTMPPNFLPTDLAVDSSGNIYLAADLDFSLIKISTNP